MSSSRSSRRRRIAASRANGSKSRGPVTPEGKARSAANAPIRHGLASTTNSQAPDAICYSNEDRAQFQALYAALAVEHAPVDTTEHLIVYEMAVARWRLHRTWLLEAATVDNQMDRMAGPIAETYASIDETTRAALAIRELADESSSLQLLSRYETRLSRQFDRCLARLFDLRAKRAKQSRIEEFPSEPSPEIEHQKNHDARTTTTTAAATAVANDDDDQQLPPDPPNGGDGAMAVPQHPPRRPGPGHETRITPPEQAPAMADLCSQVRRHALSPSAGDPPPLPGAA
jgi:hypothetical protein